MPTRRRQPDFQQAAARGEFANAGLAQQLAQAQTGFNAQNMARNQYMNEQYAQRNQPINEISSLLCGSQINNPNFVNTPNNQIPTTDVAGLINNRFSQDMDDLQAAEPELPAAAGRHVRLDGRHLEGRHRAAVGRAREGEHHQAGQCSARRDSNDNELPIYEYSYKGDPASVTHVGPMAQDVEKIDPSAVIEHKGRKYIDGGKLGSVLGMAA